MEIINKAREWINNETAESILPQQEMLYFVF